MCHCPEYKLVALQVRISEKNILNATTQQFIIANISGCALKQGVKHTHQCVRAIFNYKMRLPLMYCLIRAVEHRKCVAGLADAQPGFKDRILLTTHELRMRI